MGFRGLGSRLSAAPEELCLWNCWAYKQHLQTKHRLGKEQATGWQISGGTSLRKTWDPFLLSGVGAAGKEDNKKRGRAGGSGEGHQMAERARTPTCAQASRAPGGARRPRLRAGISGLGLTETPPNHPLSNIPYTALKSSIRGQLGCPGGAWAFGFWG